MSSKDETRKFFLIYFILLDQKKVTKKNQEIAKAIAINCNQQTKAKMFPGLQHSLTLLFVFAAPISNNKITHSLFQKHVNIHSCLEKM